MSGQQLRAGGDGVSVQEVLHDPELVDGIVMLRNLIPGCPQTDDPLTVLFHAIKYIPLLQELAQEQESQLAVQPPGMPLTQRAVELSSPDAYSSSTQTFVSRSESESDPTLGAIDPVLLAESSNRGAMTEKRKRKRSSSLSSQIPKKSKEDFLFASPSSLAVLYVPQDPLDLCKRFDASTIPELSDGMCKLTEHEDGGYLVEMSEKLYRSAELFDLKALFAEPDVCSKKSNHVLRMECTSVKLLAHSDQNIRIIFCRPDYYRRYHKKQWFKAQLLENYDIVLASREGDALNVLHPPSVPPFHIRELPSKFRMWQSHKIP